MENPKSKEDLQQFLGMITYLSKFIPVLPQTAAPPLRDKDTEWNLNSVKPQPLVISYLGIQYTIL